jgi:plastocyanin
MIPSVYHASGSDSLWFAIVSLVLVGFVAICAWFISQRRRVGSDVAAYYPLAALIRKKTVMRRAVVVIVALVLAGAACSSTNSSGGGSSTNSSGGGGCTASNATDLTGDNSFTVTIEGRAFHPDCFKAKSTASITIVNKSSSAATFTIDGTQVDVRTNGGQTFNGESAGLAPGTYTFHCKINPTMTGTVILT